MVSNTYLVNCTLPLPPVNDRIVDHELVSPALPPREMDIELQSNQAYGQVTSVHVY